MLTIIAIALGALPGLAGEAARGFSRSTGNVVGVSAAVALGYGAWVGLLVLLLTTIGRSRLVPFRAERAWRLAAWSVASVLLGRLAGNALQRMAAGPQAYSWAALVGLLLTYGLVLAGCQVASRRSTGSV